MNLDVIRSCAERPEPHRLFEAVSLSLEGNDDAKAEICGAMIWSSFAAPSSIPVVFDLIFGPRNKISDHNSLGKALETDLPEGFWHAFRSTLVGPENGYDASSITLAVASLNLSLDPRYAELSECAAKEHPGAVGASKKKIPTMLSMTELKAQPLGSLAGDLHDMWLDNGFDPEVLDRDAIGLRDLAPSIRYLNTRILQMHDVWHLMAGYQTTSLHEMAISAFQLAQFGHNYSAMFLSTICTMSLLKEPIGFIIVLQNIAEAWQHGCQSPAFMAIDWETEWHMDIESLRVKYGIRPFSGSFPADLLEKVANTT